MFQFWVRAFFFLIEDIGEGKLFTDVAPAIKCKEIPKSQFEEDYKNLLTLHHKTGEHAASRTYEEVHTSLKARTFSECYTIIDTEKVKSSVAISNGEYLAHFRILSD